MTFTVKPSVYSSVVERLMITTQNHLLTRGSPESAATVEQFHEAAGRSPTIYDAKPTAAEKTKHQHEDLKQQKTATKQQHHDNMIMMASFSNTPF